MRTRLVVHRAAFDVAPDAALRGLSDGGEFILEESQRQVPIEEAVLEGSGTVTVERGQTRDEVSVSYDTPYAVRQHEDTTLRHDEGRKAKYLEDPMKEHGRAAFEHAAAVARDAAR